MNAATAGGILGGSVTASVLPLKTDMSNARRANSKSSAAPTGAGPAGTNHLRIGMDDSDCNFVLQSGSIAAQLRIEVRTLNDPKKQFASYALKCGGKGTALQAVGNEALSCQMEGNAGQIVGIVVGRVRERVFVLRLSTNEKSASGVLEEKLRRAADIVAGNLF